MLSSNNYLGLASHPRVKRASQEAIERYGCSTGAARRLGGLTVIQKQLEEELAKFKSTDSAVVFTSGYTANVGTIQALMGKEDMIFSDELNHASIVDGCRLSGARVEVFPHCDTVALERILANSRARKKLVVTDSVFSMNGDIAPIPDLVRLAGEFNASLMVDDAHATGVLGEHGGGCLDHFHLEGQAEVVMGTLGKALGSVGGFIAGSSRLVEFLESKGRSILFTTALPPAAVAASLEALMVIREEPELRRKLWHNTTFFRDRLKRNGLHLLPGETPIIPIIVGETSQAERLAGLLFSKGIFVSRVGYPYVPEGQARLRTIVSAQHTTEELAYCADAISESIKEMGLEQKPSGQ
ncbi:MAG: aminotransferase class I/II-fold pyridoxal phosphate-dependent enzyme [Thaumarchaeota archaeon]|nr:aminotransferase class I/II-fold pyridoxal phosphate-dependent enzyme [Nitrososphaerota archaeon]